MIGEIKFSLLLMLASHAMPAIAACGFCLRGPRFCPRLIEQGAGEKGQGKPFVSEFDDRISSSDSQGYRYTT